MLRKLFARDALSLDNLKYGRSEIEASFHTDKLILCLGKCNFIFLDFVTL
jgi:hypothetical protein